jgi:hypothetical protein
MFISSRGWFNIWSRCDALHFWLRGCARREAFGLTKSRNRPDSRYGINLKIAKIL